MINFNGKDAAVLGVGINVLEDMTSNTSATSLASLSATGPTQPSAPISREACSDTAQLLVVLGVWGGEESGGWGGVIFSEIGWEEWVPGGVPNVDSGLCAVGAGVVLS